MKIKKFISVLLILTSVFLCIPVAAAESPAYTALAEQEPVIVRELTLDELEAFFTEATTDEILDPAECNYIYGEVSMGGVAEFCHVYMRTFNLIDAVFMSAEELETLPVRIMNIFKEAVKYKYIKIIGKMYNVRISSRRGQDGKTEAVYVKMFFACGEKTEDRQTLCEGLVSDIVSELTPLDDGERFLRLNDIMLDGRFKYDMSLYHRCSSVAFVKDGKGVCEDYSGLTALVLDALGYENYIIIGDIYGTPHMWNFVKVKDRYYHLDILHDGPVNSDGVHTAVFRTFLLVSEKSVKTTHTVSEQYAQLSSFAQHDYVFDGYPVNLDNTTEADGKKYMIKSAPGITVSELEAELFSAGFLTVKKDDAALGEDDVIGTGCIVSLEVNGEVIDSCTFAAKGDVNGDGAFGEEDMELITAYLLTDGDGAEYVFTVAADMDENGVVTVTDLICAYDTIRQPTAPPEEEPAPETTDTTEAEE